MAETENNTATGAKEVIRARSTQIALIQDSKGLGTGIVCGNDGWIVTNKHVAPSVGPYRVVLANGTNVAGVGVHQSVHHDLAIVKVGIETPDFFSVENDFAEDFRVGEEVFALGHPRGCRFSVTRGIISNPHREFDKEYFVQCDAAINPGNSGGPLVNTEGNLVGVVTMQLSYSQGLGFAIPGYTVSDYVRYVRRLIRQGVVRIPEALLEAAKKQSQPAEEVIRTAVDQLGGTGRLSIEEEKPEDGYAKLKRKSFVVEVSLKDEVFNVSSKVCSLGPAERKDSQFLLKILRYAADLGGSTLFLREDELMLSHTRPTTGLDVTEAVWAIDLVSHQVEEVNGKVTAMMFHAPTTTPTDPTQPAQPKEPEKPAVDPGYPLIQFPHGMPDFSGGNKS